MKQKNVFKAFYSGFRLHHSTETVLMKVLNDIHQKYDVSKTSVLVLQDVSAVFDTADHGILSRLETHQHCIFQYNQMATVPYFH